MMDRAARQGQHVSDLLEGDLSHERRTGVAKPGSPAQRLTSWVDTFIASSKPNALLPPDSALVVQFGVSLSTVRRVLKTFAEKGLVSRGPGRPTRTATPVPEIRAGEGQVSAVSSVASIADMLYRQICAGVLKRGNEVPQIKNLSRTWHVAPATVIAACRRLCDQGVLTRAGRGYLVGAPEQLLPDGERKQVIAFESPLMPIAGIYSGHPLSLAYQAMEFELLRSGYSVTYRALGELQTLCRSWREGGRIPHGLFMPYVNDDEMATVTQTLGELVGHAGALRPGILVGGKGRGPKLAGVNYFNHGHVNTEWFRTLAGYVGRKRYPAVYVYFGGQHFAVSNGSLLKLWVELRHIAPEIDIRYVIVSDDACSLSAPDLLRILTSRPDNHTRAVLSKYTPTDPSELCGTLVAYGSFDEAQGASAPGSVWVFRAQDDAARALDLLAARPSRSGQSVISLENRPDYFTKGITACVPDTYTMGYQMAHAIIGDYPVARSHQGYMRAPIVVLERASTIWCAVR